jgi:hypothetical protein
MPMMGSTTKPPEMIPTEADAEHSPARHRRALRVGVEQAFAAFEVAIAAREKAAVRLEHALIRRTADLDAREQVAAAKQAADLTAAREAHARALEQANNEHVAKLAAERAAAEQELAARGVTTAERESAAVERERALDRRTANLDAREAALNRRLRAVQEAAAA